MNKVSKEEVWEALNKTSEQFAKEQNEALINERIALILARYRNRGLDVTTPPDIGYAKETK